MNQEIKARIEQIKRGEVPQGYKKTKVGIVPSEWEIKRLGAIGKNHIGLTYSPEDVTSDSGTLVLRSSNIVENKILLENNVYVKKDVSDKSKVKENDILICARNGSTNLIGKCAMTGKKEENLFFGAFMSVFRSDYFKYLFYVFQSYTIISQIQKNLGARINQITSSDLNAFISPFPPLPEQQKIADILTTQDKVIELKEKLIAEKQRQKKWLMQNLLTGKKRLKGFSGDWKERPVSHYLVQQVEKQMPTEDIPLMAFTAKGGVESKGERYDRSFLVKNDDKLYKRTCLNDFIYSSNNLDVGSIGLNLYGDAVISAVYEIFKVKNTAIPIIIDRIIRMPHNISKMIQFRQGVIYGQYRIHADDFLGIHITLPSLPEQTAIAEILSTADREIELLQKGLAKEKQKKKALMQLLLTGIVRV